MPISLTISPISKHSLVRTYCPKKREAASASSRPSFCNDSAKSIGYRNYSYCWDVEWAGRSPYSCQSAFKLSLCPQALCRRGQACHSHAWVRAEPVPPAHYTLVHRRGRSCVTSSRNCPQNSLRTPRTSLAGLGGPKPVGNNDERTRRTV